jgi:hypothetical protein
MKKTVLVLVILVIALLAWGLIQSGNGYVSVTLNGHELSGPMKAAVGSWGIIIATVVLFCVAILVTFVLTGVGLVILGCLVLVGMILAAVAFPFLLPLLIPLFIVWAFAAGVRRGKSNMTKTPSSQPSDGTR